MARKGFLLFVFCSLLFTLTLSAQVSNTKLTGQRFSGEITVNSSSEAVWGVLTDMKKISKIMDYESDSMAKFSKPGDQAKLTIWGDTGSYILIYSKPGEEVRYMWEPDNGTYLCQTRWQLSSSGKTTKVIFEDRYTESGPQSEDDIKAQVKGYNDALSRLKAICEGKGT